MSRLVAPLFVPGDRADRVRKARARGADVIIIDLEDAVPPERKPAARQLAADVLAEDHAGALHLVRVNAASAGELMRQDVDALADVLAGLDGLVLAKVVDADEVRALDALVAAAAGVPVPVIPTIESALGVREAYAIAAASPSVLTLLFGVVDLSAELGVTATPGGIELVLARSTLVLACAAAGIAKPLDGPHLSITDTAGLDAGARHARALGFGGKIVIHPDQLDTVRNAFAPTADEIVWAHTVVDAYERVLRDGVGVVKTADGTFVDIPVAQRARSILAAAGNPTHSAGGTRDQPDR